MGLLVYFSMPRCGTNFRIVTKVIIFTPGVNLDYRFERKNCFKNKNYYE